MSTHPTYQDRILHLAPCVTAVVSGRQHEIEFGNVPFVRLFGTADRGRVVHDRPRLADRRLRACVDQVLASGRGRRVRGVPVRRAASSPDRTLRVRYFDLFVKPAGTEVGAPGKALVFGVDVTSRVREERRLRQQVDRYARLLEATATRVWVADGLGADVREAGTGKRLAPLDPSPLADRGANGSDDGEGEASGRETLTCPPPVQAWREAVHAGASFAVTRPVGTPEGEHWMLTRAIPVPNGSRGVRQWLGLDIDVTDHVDAVLSMRASAERRITDVGGHLARVLESQHRLMRGFGHDIRNMLNAADGYAQLLEKKLYGRLTGEQHQSIERIRGLLGSAGALVSDVIRVARAETGLIRLHRVPTDLTDVIAEAVEGHRAEAVLKKLTLTLERAENSFRTYTDPARVRQILDNLMSNAVKFTDEGGVAVRAWSQTGREQGDRRRWIAVSVTDTGPGIAEEHRERIFDEFVRVRPTGKEGAGIGLSISRRIAELIGGSITVDGAVGKGSVFTLWLPVERAAARRKEQRNAA
jgi:signal transduction histidine kinase